MFVLKTNYERVVVIANHYIAEHGALLKRWNALVNRLNAHGGEAVFTRAASTPQFTKEEVQQLIRLCHPDKHQNSTASNQMTAKLLALKTSMKD